MTPSLMRPPAAGTRWHAVLRGVHTARYRPHAVGETIQSSPRSAHPAIVAPAQDTVKAAGPGPGTAPTPFTQVCTFSREVTVRCRRNTNCRNVSQTIEIRPAALSPRSARRIHRCPMRNVRPSPGLAEQRCSATKRESEDTELSMRGRRGTIAAHVCCMQTCTVRQLNSAERCRQSPGVLCPRPQAPHPAPIP